jgi:hypothetical protein
MVGVDLRCPDCGAPMELRYSKRFDKKFWGCSRWSETGCKGIHGAHPDGRPLGIPANRETKDWRILAHAWFDSLWHDEARHAMFADCRTPLMLRKDAYRWMQKAMNMTSDQAHIGMFDKYQCEMLISRVREFLGVT